MFKRLARLTSCKSSPTNPMKGALQLVSENIDSGCGMELGVKVVDGGMFLQRKLESKKECFVEAVDSVLHRIPRA